MGVGVTDLQWEEVGGRGVLFSEGWSEGSIYVVVLGGVGGGHICNGGGSGGGLTDLQWVCG